jgi:hypothetical protein
MTTTVSDVAAVDAEAYREQGFVLVPQVFDAETMARARAEADAMLARVVEAGTKVEATWKGKWREKLIRAEHDERYGRWRRDGHGQRRLQHP